MPHPDGAHTHGGPALGGTATLIIGAVLIYACRNQLASVADSLLDLAAVILAVTVVAGIALVVLLERRRREEAQAVAGRVQQAAQWRAEAEGRKARAVAVESRALPAPQPVIQVINVIDRTLLASLLGDQQAVRVIPGNTEEVR